MTLGVLFLISSLVSLFMQYTVFDSIRVMSDMAPLDTIQAAISAVPPTNMTLIVLSWIVTLALMLFTSGYIYDVIKFGIEKKSELPDFKDVKRIFINGVRSFIVGIAYSILPMILFFLGLMLTVNEAVDSSVNAIGGFILYLRRKICKI